MNIAQKALEIINGDREQTHGDASKNLNLIAELWASYLGVEIKNTDVCNMMCLLKIARLKNKPDNEDSKVDLIGYTLLHERIGASRDDDHTNKSSEEILKRKEDLELLRALIRYGISHKSL